MPERDGKYINPETLDPARRAEMGVSAAAEAMIDVSEDVVIVDDKLRAKEEERILRAEEAKAEAEDVTVVTKERTAAPVIEVASTRNNARLLVLTRDVSIFVEGSAALYHVEELSNMFAEVHVIVLNESKLGRFEKKRVSERLWIYPTNSMAWFLTPFDAKKVAKQELTFGGTFRPDIVLAKDVFEAGYAGRMIAKKHKRAFQVHASDDFFDPYFKDADKRNNWRLIMAGSVLKQALSLRTPSEYLKSRIEEKYPHLAGQVALLPIFYNLDAWAAAPALFDVRARYPEFRFILLHISNMNELAHTDVAIDGLFYILRQYPTIGLVIVGDGPQLDKLVKTVFDYELQNQIVFETPDIDVLSLMRSAQLLIHTSEEGQQEEIVLKAATVGLPIVAGSRGVVAELFVDEESILICPVDSPPCFGEKVNRLLNENQLRIKLAMNARDTVFASIEQDYGTYMAVYQANIEQCLEGQS